MDPYMDPVCGSLYGSYKDLIWIIYGSHVDHMDPYMDHICIPIRILHGSLYGSYIDPYMDSIWITI